LSCDHLLLTLRRPPRPTLFPYTTLFRSADVPSFDHDLYDNIADESRSYWGGAPRNVVEGQWFPDNNPMDNWDYSYAAIRKTNMFLSKADGAPVDEETRSELTGQVKFLRAMHYF